jgi:hypothetical protein
MVIGGERSQGLRQLVTTTDMERKRKQSNHEYCEVLSKQGSTLHMQHYQKEAVYVDWAAEMPE